MKRYIIYLIYRENDKAYELGILNKTGQGVFLSNTRSRIYKKLTTGYCDYLINEIGCNPSEWGFYGLRNMGEEKKMEIIQDLLATDTIGETKSILQNLEGHKIIYCYYV